MRGNKQSNDVENAFFLTISMQDTTSILLSIVSLNLEDCDMRYICFGDERNMKPIWATTSHQLVPHIWIREGIVLKSVSSSEQSALS